MNFKLKYLLLLIWFLLLIFISYRMIFASSEFDHKLLSPFVILFSTGFALISAISTIENTNYLARKQRFSDKKKNMDSFVFLSDRLSIEFENISMLLAGLKDINYEGKKDKDILKALSIPINQLNDNIRIIEDLSKDFIHKDILFHLEGEGLNILFEMHRLISFILICLKKIKYIYNMKRITFTELFESVEEKITLFRKLHQLSKIQISNKNFRIKE